MQKKIHVLVGEDDPNDRLLLEVGFRKVWPDIRVDLFANGVEVIEYLKAESSPKPSLIILDTLTSQLTGWAVMEWLQGHPTFSDIPLVMLAGQANANDRLLAEKLGAKDYLEKPHDTSELHALLKGLARFWI